MIKLRILGQKSSKKTIKELDSIINNELKKPKFWDEKNPNIYAYFLQPISLLIRLFAYFNSKKKSKKFKIKTICVGNIYIGVWKNFVKYKNK